MVGTPDKHSWAGLHVIDILIQVVNEIEVCGLSADVVHRENELRRQRPLHTYTPLLDVRRRGVRVDRPDVCELIVHIRRTEQIGGEPSRNRNAGGVSFAISVLCMR